MAIAFEAASKNRQSDEKIRELVGRAFPGKSVTEIAELNAGMCNALYKIALDDGAKVVLKVSSPGMANKCTNEQWLMESESESMKLIETCAKGVKAPKLLYYDDSLTVCTGKYFFMEYAEGELMAERMKALSKEQVDELHREVGRYVNRIGEVHNDTYGIVNSGVEFDSLFGLAKFLVHNVVGDLEKNGADVGVPFDEIRAQLEKDKVHFDAYEGKPSMVHFDIWENNIILANDEIAALLDWERTLWGEVLMEERFRAYNDIPAFFDGFFEGFGRSEFTESELKRLKWYDIWMDFASMNERYFRMYEPELADSREAKWKARFRQHWQQLTGKVIEA